MATNFTLELNHRPTKSTGRYTIFIRITQDRVLRRVKTSVTLAKKADWNNKTKSIRPSEPHHKIWNDILASELESAKEKYRKLKDEGNATIGRIKDYITKTDTPISFLEYARKRTQDIYNSGSIRNWKKYNSFCNKLEAFQTKKGKVVDLTFSELTPAYIAKFDAYLHTLHNERDPQKMLHQNYITYILAVFKRIVNRAITVDRLMKIDDNPFLTWKMVTVQTQKEKLTLEEIETIKNLELEPESTIWHAKNLFLFSFYCAGIRVGDLLQLRWCNISKDGRIQYEMGKNHKSPDLILVQPALDILKLYRHPECKMKQYIFPMLDNAAVWATAVTQEEKDVLDPDTKKLMFAQIGSKTAIINKQLKRIAELAGIEKTLSFHISRHSFARAAKVKGVDNAQVKDLLAHSNLKTTEKYMGSFDTADNDAALESIFEQPKDEIAELTEKLKGLDKERLQIILSSLGQSNQK